MPRWCGNVDGGRLRYACGGRCSQLGLPLGDPQDLRANDGVGSTEDRVRFARSLWRIVAGGGVRVCVRVCVQA